MTAGAGAAARARQRLAGSRPIERLGRVTAVTGVAVQAVLGRVPVGEVVEIDLGEGRRLPAEVVGFRDGQAVLLPLGEVRGLAPGRPVRPLGRAPSVLAGPGLLGRVLDAFGRPLDGRPLPPGSRPWPVDRPSPPALRRERVGRLLPTGIRVLDGVLPLAEGQRLGLFAGPGAGKTTLLGQVARQARADAVVVALVGERGREVREFVEGCLGPEGLARSTVVAATGDEPALVRIQAARAATALAEWLAEVEGRSVLLLVDSVTRFARAHREAGLAAGEPPARQGYPPSVFAALPRLLERAGPRERGCITAVYTVLVAGDGAEDPVGDEVRGLLDGHVELDARRAGRGWFPAVDLPRSVSRLLGAVATPRQRLLAGRLRALVDAGERVRELVELGAYQRGGDPLADEALARREAIEGFLRQGPEERTEPAETLRRLEELLA